MCDAKIDDSSIQQFDAAHSRIKEVDTFEFHARANAHEKHTGRLLQSWIQRHELQSHITHDPHVEDPACKVFNFVRCSANIFQYACNATRRNWRPCMQGLPKSYHWKNSKESHSNMHNIHPVTHHPPSPRNPLNDLGLLTPSCCPWNLLSHDGNLCERVGTWRGLC